MYVWRIHTELLLLHNFSDNERVLRSLRPSVGAWAVSYYARGRLAIVVFVILFWKFWREELVDWC